ncbi:aldehyde reductase [Plectosphaerella plurivora]|uniref:Aldehyde reductase n=1 Tax=Plectosphaerella plurivora TaxID=936078 RepID=A0A9P8VAG1_9PEZI|nr:aldehyde reductase [Plectosphaerella plurivora]
MVIPGISNPAVPYGSTIVVTGASGFIGSHVVDQALAEGYKVRATSRNVSSSSCLCEHFNKKYGPGSVDLVEVADMEVDGAFDAAVRGTAGFVHVAHDMTGSRDPDVHIPRTVSSAINALKAAATEPGLRRFVYTSSSFAVTQPKPNKQFTVTTDTFNQEAVDRCKQPNPSGETVYSASKVAAERAIAQWVQDHKPSFVVNTLQPNANIGPLIDSEKQGYPTSARWVYALWNNDYDSLANDKPQHFINVQDDARLHVIALAHPYLQHERIFAIAAPVNMQDIIVILRKLHPTRHWEDFPNNDKDLSIVEPSKRAEALLREAYGSGFIGLEDTVRGNAQDLARGYLGKDGRD